MALALNLCLLISLCLASTSAMNYHVNRYDSIVVESPTSSFDTQSDHSPFCRHRVVQQTYHQPVRTSYTQSAPVDRSQFLPYSNYYNYRPANRITTYDTVTYHQPATYQTFRQPSTYEFRQPSTYEFRQPSTYEVRQPSSTRNECARCVETNRRTHFPTESRHQAPVENSVPYVQPEQRAPEPPVLSYLPPVEVKESPILTAVMNYGQAKSPVEEAPTTTTTTEAPAFTFRANPPKDNYGRKTEARSVTEATKAVDDTSEMAQSLTADGPKMVMFVRKDANSRMVMGYKNSP